MSLILQCDEWCDFNLISHNLLNWCGVFAGRRGGEKLWNTLINEYCIFEQEDWFRSKVEGVLRFKCVVMKWKYDSLCSCCGQNNYYLACEENMVISSDEE